MSSENKRTFLALTAFNWGQWSDDMEAYLATKELWEYVDGSTPRPTFANAVAPTAGESKELSEWKRKAICASGEIWLAIEDSQKVYVKEVKNDPALMSICRNVLGHASTLTMCFSVYVKTTLKPCSP